MKMEGKKRAALLLAIDLFIILSTVICLISFFRSTGNTGGTGCLRYYTVLSNLYMAFSCLVSAKFRIQKLGNVDAKCEAVELLRLSATASVTLTCLTVVFFLSAFLGLEESFGDENLFYHLLNPMFAFLGYVFLEDRYDTGRKSFIVSAVPTFLYGVFYFIMVVIMGEKRGGWPDFYGFNRGGLWPVSLVSMFTAILLISYFLYRIRKKVW